MKKGFTLIEFLISATVFVVVLGVALLVLSTGWRVWQRSSLEIKSFQVSRMVMERMVAEVRSAREIMSSSDNNILLLNYFPNVIAYDFDKGKVRRRKNQNVSYLTNEGEVKGLTFDYKAPQTVQILIEVKEGVFMTGEALVRNQSI